jgi:hypothetical protein
MGGLFVATFLTLLFLPALYAVWFRKQIRAEQRAERDGTAMPPALQPAPAE